MELPDIEAIITFLRPEEGGRKTPIYSGYRPAHLVKEDYLTTGVHKYYDRKCVLPGESVLGTIAFITPEAYPNCLWEGKILRIQEGGRVVGYAKIVKIFNNILTTRYRA